MTTHTADYDPKTFPLTLRFQRFAHPEYFNEHNEFDDELRWKENERRWERRAQNLGLDYTGLK